MKKYFVPMLLALLALFALAGCSKPASDTAAPATATPAPAPTPAPAARAVPRRLVALHRLAAWAYAQDTGILKKWADKYGIQIELTLVNDYVEIDDREHRLGKLKGYHRPRLMVLDHRRSAASTAVAVSATSPPATTAS